MARWTRLLPALLTLAFGAACPTLPDEVSTDLGGSSSGSTGDGMTSPTVGMTMTNGDTLGTMGGSSGSTGPIDPTTGNVDTTMGVSATEGTTTDEPGTTSLGTTTSPGSSSGGSSSGGIPDCMVDGDCGSNEVCDTGTCVEACMGMWGMGNYGECLNDLGGFDTMASCGAGTTCIFNGYPIEGTTCSNQNCTDACDCPAPPATGDAVVSCANITTGGGAVNDCYLSCANGETCPDGMFCYNGTVTDFCMTAPDPLPMWGNCGNVVAGCAAGSVCVVENGYTACIALCPGGVGDCDAAPLGANPAECNGVIFPPNGADCILPCTSDTDCPGPMECYDDPSVMGSDSTCMWPMVSVIEGMDCCTPNPGPGCTVAPIETCTCAIDDYCCTTQWDMVCVNTALSDCYMDCP